MTEALEVTFMNETDIEKYYDNAAMLLQTLQQIEKDFAMCGVDLELNIPEKISYRELFDLIADRLLLLMKSNNEKLNNLLYRVDLSMEQIKKHSNQSTDKPFNEILAELIIKRELQKVVLRNFYK